MRQQVEGVPLAAGRQLALAQLLQKGAVHPAEEVVAIFLALDLVDQAKVLQVQGDHCPAFRRALADEPLPLPEEAGVVVSPGDRVRKGDPPHLGAGPVLVDDPARAQQRQQDGGAHGKADGPPGGEVDVGGDEVAGDEGGHIQPVVADGPVVQPDLLPVGGGEEDIARPALPQALLHLLRPPLRLGVLGGGDEGGKGPLGGGDEDGPIAVEDAGAPLPVKAVVVDDGAHLLTRFDARQHPRDLPVAGEGDQVEKPILSREGAEDARAVECRLKGGQFAQINGIVFGEGVFTRGTDHGQFVKFCK